MPKVLTSRIDSREYTLTVSGLELIHRVGKYAEVFLYGEQASDVVKDDFVQQAAASTTVAPSNPDYALAVLEEYFRVTLQPYEHSPDT